ncbi:MAG: HepT-like ribonuclease domain-containing protein [Patescibacteria group bacterium]
MNRDKLHLLHIRDDLAKIEEYSKSLDCTKFAERDREFDAIMMRVIKIGEEVNSLSEELKEKYRDLPWHKAVGFKNQVAHGYLDIKPSLAWETITKDLPILKKDIENILKQY